jgi:hypothetical protein
MTGKQEFLYSCLPVIPVIFEEKSFLYFKLYGGANFFLYYIAIDCNIKRSITEQGG